MRKKYTRRMPKNGVLANGHSVVGDDKKLSVVNEGRKLLSLSRRDFNDGYCFFGRTGLHTRLKREKVNGDYARYLMNVKVKMEDL